MIAESLAGKTIAVTGATGFLGTALVERLLRSVPECRVICITRPTRRFSPLERIKREVVGNDCFDRLRKELGDEFDAVIDRRLGAIAGDVGTDGLGLDDEGREQLRNCDVVVHSAATVSFESPLDQAAEVNLLGPSRVAHALAEAGSNAHLIAVSTAYVAGNRRGEAFEELVTDTWYSPDVNWRAEVNAARRVLEDAENESRQLERLADFTKQSRRELGAAGTPLIATRAEKIRMDWVKQRLVKQGKARAQSLGWPDVYAYTKALGERALLEQRGNTPVTFLRPSIIESALSEPFPGWIRGFRMAEPILIGTGKGLLKQFPGLPEGVLDVIPVDKVVAAIVTVAAAPAPESPCVYQVASGTRQPLRYRKLVDLVTAWYRDNPLYDTDGQPIIVPEWQYPARGKLQKQLDRAIKAMSVTEQLLQHLPLRGTAGELSAQLEEKRTLAERASGYVEIYGAYTESEARFRIDRSLRLFESLSEEDKRRFDFDPIDIDWRHYLHDIHLPSIIEQGRVRTTGGGKKGTVDRATRARRNILSTDRHLAVFGFENTIVHSNVASSYAWLSTRHLSTPDRLRLIARKLPEAPAMFMMDRRDRGDFLRSFYRWYAGAPVEQLRRDGVEMFNQMLMTKAFPDALKRIREHREAGHRTLLITGALDIVVESLRPLFDDIVCSEMSQVDGRYTGELLDAPPVGEARALLVKDHAEQNGLDLQQTVAYADSASDLPVLEVVGYPVAVNPETRLAAISRRRGWHVEHWKDGGHVPLLPMAPAPRPLKAK